MLPLLRSDLADPRAGLQGAKERALIYDRRIRCGQFRQATLSCLEDVSYARQQAPVRRFKLDGIIAAGKPSNGLQHVALQHGSRHPPARANSLGVVRIGEPLLEGLGLFLGRLSHSLQLCEPLIQVVELLVQVAYAFDVRWGRHASLFLPGGPVSLPAPSIVRLPT
jgi:hypothetical protein